jgi:anthranilate/para-aminobenzoate synthase component I
VDTMLVFDHVKHTIKVLSYVDLDGDVEAEYRRATGRIDELIERLGEPLKPADTGETPAEQRYEHSIISNVSKKEFEAAVDTIKEYITEGEAIQVVLSQRMAKRTDIDPFEIYRALRSINPSPYMFFLDYGDIGRVSEPGTVEVSELMEVERYSHVMHLVTHVEGKLRKELTVFDALSACFPAGTVSGAPKIRAMEIIAGLEPEMRGPYAGAVGYFSFSDNMDMAIAIRTMVVKDGTAYVQAGCGIVYDSVPEKEYQETLNKAMAQLKAIDRAEQRKITRSGDYALID